MSAIIISHYAFQGLNRFRTIQGFFLESNLGKELDLLLMWRLFHTAAAHNCLCKTKHQKNFSRLMGSNNLLLAVCVDEEVFYQDAL